jgi:hypothetical protein
MKRFLLLCLISAPAFGQWAVVDVSTMASVETMNSAQLAQWAEGLKKFEAQIGNQVKQLEEAKKLLNMQNTISSKIGDWQGVLDRARSLQTRVEALTKDVGVNWRLNAVVDYGQPSLGFTGNGTFRALATTTTGGSKVIVDEQELRRYESVERFYGDVNRSFDETEEKRKQILTDIGETAEQLVNAKTQEESAKFYAKLETLKASLSNVQAQRDEKMQRMLVQKALTESVDAKETKVASQVQDESAKETFKAIGKTKVGGSSFR